MPRIKKQGLDYFPLNTDFIHDRLVRRIMKREGDASLSVLIEVLSYIYSGEGYYVCADALFYEDLSSNLYEKTSDDIRRIVSLAVEYGIFDAALHAKYGILTSADIQRQYLFSTKRRNVSHLDPAYCLISEELLARPSGKNGAGNRSSQPRETVNSVNETSMESSVTADEQGGSDELEVNVNRAENGSFIPENVTSGTHSIAQNSIAQQSIAQRSIEYPLLNSSPSGRTQDADRESAEGDGEEENFLSSPATPASLAAFATFAAPAAFVVPVSPAVPVSSVAHASSAVPPSVPPAPSVAPLRHPRKEWTDEDICRMQPPPDGVNRNLDGLLFNLRQLRISPPEQRAIILKSNFGAIGHPMWKGFSTIRESCGKIRQPGRFLLSLCNKTGVHEE